MNRTEMAARAAEGINRAKCARDRLKSSKPSVLNAQQKLEDAIEVIDALIVVVENLQHTGGKL